VRKLVLTSPRTASTSFCTLLSKLYGLYDVGEPYPLYYGSTMDISDNKVDLGGILQESTDLYLNNMDACLKIHSGHVAEYMPHRHKGWFQDILNSTHDIYFLLRRDTQAQIKSLFVANYYSTLIDKKDKFFNTAYNDSWQDELVIPDTPLARAEWKISEMIVHTNLVALSTLYHTLLKHDPIVVWSEDILDILPGSKYHRPVRIDWEPEYMFSNDDFFPAKINEIFKRRQSFL